MSSSTTGNLSLTIPARMRVVREIRLLLNKSPSSQGDPLPSERALAAQLGVSRETVRSALRDLRKAGVVDRQTGGAGRTIISSATPGESFMSGAVAMLTYATDGRVSGPMTPGRDLFIQIELTRLLNDAKVHALLLSPEGLDPAGYRRLIESRPGALAATYAVGDCESGRKILSEVAAAGIPIVVNGSHASLSDYDRVVSDHAMGSAMLVKWLAAAGRKKVLRFWRFEKKSDWLHQRNIGYESAMSEAGLSVLPAFHTTDFKLAGEFHREEFDHIKRMLAGYLIEAFATYEGLDAIMVATDLHAYQVNAALRMIGKTPGKDVLVVGYDNTYAAIEASKWEPVGPAATIDKDNPKIAEAMASLLVGRVEGRLPAERQCLFSNPRLVVTS